MEIAEKLLKKLLTLKEKKGLQKRYKIMQFLKTNLTYREIARQMGISTTTVVRLNQRLKIRRPKLRLKASRTKSSPTVKQKIKIKPQNQSAKVPWIIG